MPATTEPEMEKIKTVMIIVMEPLLFLFCSSYFIIHSDFKFPTAEILELSYAKLVS